MSGLTCGMRAAGVPGRGENGKTCKVRQAAFVHEIERAHEHRLGLGRKSGDDVGAEHHVRPQPPHLFAERDRVGAQVPPLHALEDEIVARLQRQMQMRHQPRFVGERVEQIAIGLDRIDRGQPQPRQLRHVLEDRLHQRAEPRRARQVGAIAGDIDAGEHDLAIAVARQAAAPRRPRRPSAPSANCRGHTE